MQDFTDTLIKDYEPAKAEIDKTAAKQFEDELKKKNLDLLAWHKAYDARVKEAGLENLFTKSGRVKQGSWQEIKEIEDPELQAAIKKLYRAASYQGITTPEGRDRLEKQYAKREAEREENNRRRNAWAMKNLQYYCDRATSMAVRALIERAPKLVAEYEELSGKKLANTLKFVAEVPTDLNEPATYWVPVTLDGYEDFKYIGNPSYTKELQATPQYSGVYDAQLDRMVKEVDTNDVGFEIGSSAAGIVRTYIRCKKANGEFIPYGTKYEDKYAEEIKQDFADQTETKETPVDECYTDENPFDIF